MTTTNFSAPIFFSPYLQTSISTPTDPAATKHWDKGEGRKRETAEEEERKYQEKESISIALTDKDKRRVLSFTVKNAPKYCLRAERECCPTPSQVSHITMSAHKHFKVIIIP